jgi:hypothetical protein
MRRRKFTNPVKSGRASELEQLIESIPPQPVKLEGKCRLSTARFLFNMAYAEEFSMCRTDDLFVIVSSLQPLVRRSADNLGNEKYPG